MNKDISIKVEDVSKQFLLPHQKKTSIKSIFINPFSKYDKEKQVAFKDLTFEIKKGEFFGIVGRNGSGKSTLLKCMAGVYYTDKGDITVDGKLVPFIELGVGFNPELSGRDNVYLNGALLGFNRREIDAMYDEIVAFAELEKFMDQKLNNYSSGMQVRLAFSIAIQAKGDILLLDEVLAVGDSAFQQKCYDYFATLKNSDKTIVLVSHNMQAVERFCDRALLLEAGEIKKIGDSTEVSEMYEQMFLEEEATRIAKQRADFSQNSVSPEDRLVEVQSVKVLAGKTKANKVKTEDDVIIEVKINSLEDLNYTDIGINIKDKDKNVLLDSSIFR